MSIQPGRSLGNKVVLAKIPREEFTRFQNYCDRNGETINSSLRNMILSLINDPRSSRVAARSKFLYNRRNDTFSWTVVLDDDTVSEIDTALSPITLEQFREAISSAVAERDSFLKKSRSDSAAFPTKLMRPRP